MNRKEKIARKWITFTRIIKTGCINFVRNASLSIAAMAVMLITLTIILFSIITNATFSNTVKQITDRIDVSVYLKDTVTSEQKDKLIADLQAISNVKSIEYVSKEQALENYRQQNADNSDLLVAITQTANPLPASLSIKPHDTNRINEIKVFLESNDVQALQSDPTSYSGDRKEAIDKITHATSFFRTAGAVGVLVFAAVSMLIIFNTIRMAIFNRRSELTIMRLLGASTSYIRGPFIVETILYGLISATVSVVLLNGLFAAASSTLQASSLGLLDINYSYQYFSNHFWLFLTGQIGIGIVIGTVSSLIATRRYLKFKTTK